MAGRLISVPELRREADALLLEHQAQKFDRVTKAVGLALARLADWLRTGDGPIAQARYDVALLRRSLRNVPPSSNPTAAVEDFPGKTGGQIPVCSWCQSVYDPVTHLPTRKLTPVELERAESHGICKPCGDLFKAETRRRAKELGVNPLRGKVRGNEVWFKLRGRKRLGWIHQSTPTRLRVWYIDAQQRPRTTWRPKAQVFSASTDRPFPRRRNAGAGRTLPERVRKAARLSEAFHGFKPRRLKSINIEWPKALVALGQCSRVDYQSDKFDGKPRVYFHNFEGPAQLFAPEHGDGLLIIKGSFQVKQEGLVG